MAISDIYLDMHKTCDPEAIMQTYRETAAAVDRQAILRAYRTTAALVIVQSENAETEKGGCI